MPEKISRRIVLQQGTAAGILAVWGVACGKQQPKALVCTDTSALTPADLQVRTVLAYQDLSTTPGKSCTNCQQFVIGPPGTCGTCKIVKGPINPTGYCKSFIAKPA